MMQTALNRLEARWQMLREERSGWESAWRDLALHFLPTGWRYDRDRQAGKKPIILNNRLLNSVGVLAMRTLAAGLQGSMTSPARPWFRLGLADADLMRRPDVGSWLDEVTRRMQTLFHNSNFYNAIHALYADLGTFGTGVMLEEADEEGLHFFTLRAGEYCLDVNARGEVNTLFHRVSMTARQMLDRFGPRVPDFVRTAADRPGDNQRFDVIHAVLPPGEYADPTGKNCQSVWWLEGRRGVLLHEGGYRSFPAFCPRWDVVGLDVYGRSPAMDVLADCRMLQAQTETLRRMQHKIADPPLVVDGQLRSSGVDLRPAGLTYVSMAGVNPAQAVVPIQQPAPAALQYTMQGIAEVERLIHDGLYTDLFRMLMDSDRRQITATEIEAREKEKLILIGPVVERLQKELYTPLIERTFALMEDWDLIPDVPDSLSGQTLDISFVSALAQAQRMLGRAGLEQTLNFAFSMAQADPAVMDNLDLDAALTEYAESMGTPKAVLRDEKQRETMRRQRMESTAQAEQQSQESGALQNARELAGAVKDLGQLVTDTDSQTPLKTLIGGLGGL